MSILKKRNILKLAATFMLVGMMVGTFAMHTKAAFAERADPCGSGNTVTISTNCTIAVSVSPSAITDLSFTASSIVASSPHVGLNLFTFTANVADVRTPANAGWHLLAQTDGTLDDISPSIDTLDTKSCVPGTTVGTNCPDPMVVTTPLTTGTASRFATAAATATDTAAGDDASGTVNFTVHGSYTIPLGTASATTFAGNITLTILSTPT